MLKTTKKLLVLALKLTVILGNFSSFSVFAETDNSAITNASSTEPIAESENESTVITNTSDIKYSFDVSWANAVGSSVADYH